MPSPLCALGHVATRRDLENVGLDRRQIDAIAAAESVARVRKGLYVCRHLTRAERIAVDVGGRLDCVTVLARHKIWVGHTRGLHLRMPAKAGSHASARLDLARALTARFPLLGSPRITPHWSVCAPPQRGARLEVPIVDALHEAMSCLPPDDVVAALESALHLRKISASELEQLMLDAPRRLHRVLRELTPGAQSGYETKARLRLRRLGHTVEIQVLVPGVGHLDTLVDGVVALEIDGRETHAETFEQDRDRDLGTEGSGIRCLRVPAVWIDTRWGEIVATVERMIAGAGGTRAGKRRGKGRKPG